jgi:hypothetical protein
LPGSLESAWPREMLLTKMLRVFYVQIRQLPFWDTR